MSIAAMNWAMGQRTGAPSAQCVLYVIADVAQPDGIAFCSLGYMAERSQQSVATVRRRLKELEDMGLLVRFERHEQTGRRTSDEIRLQMGAAAVSMDDPAGDNADESAGGESGESAASRPCQSDRGDPANLTGGPCQSDRGDPATAESGGPYQWCKGIEPLLEPDSHPLTPSPEGGESSGDGSDGKSGETALERFKAAYPCPTTQPGKLGQLWAALNGAEREEAVRGAQGYAVHCERTRRTSPLDPVKFVRDQLWNEFARLAPKPPPRAVFVARGTPAWAALCVLRAVAFGREETLPPAAPDPRSAPAAVGREGTLVSESADLGAMESLAQFAGADGRPDFDAWQLCEKGTPQFAAWSQRVARLMPGWTIAEQMFDGPGAPGTQTFAGKTYTVPDRRAGCMVPAEWPPRLTGDATSRTTGESKTTEAAE